MGAGVGHNGTLLVGHGNRRGLQRIGHPSVDVSFPGVDDVRSEQSTEVCVEGAKTTEAERQSDDEAKWDREPEEEHCDEERSRLQRVHAALH